METITVCVYIIIIKYFIFHEYFQEITLKQKTQCQSNLKKYNF